MLRSFVSVLPLLLRFRTALRFRVPLACLGRETSPFSKFIHEPEISQHEMEAAKIQDVAVNLAECRLETNYRPDSGQLLLLLLTPCFPFPDVGAQTHGQHRQHRLEAAAGSGWVEAEEAHGHPGSAQLQHQPLVDHEELHRQGVDQDSNAGEFRGARRYCRCASIFFHLFRKLTFATKHGFLIRWSGCMKV